MREEPLLGSEKFAYPTVITSDLKMSKADGFPVLEFLAKNPQ